MTTLGGKTLKKKKRFGEDSISKINSYFYTKIHSQYQCQHSNPRSLTQPVQLDGHQFALLSARPPLFLDDCYLMPDVCKNLELNEK